MFHDLSIVVVRIPISPLWPNLGHATLFGGGTTADLCIEVPRFRISAPVYYK